MQELPTRRGVLPHISHAHHKTTAAIRLVLGTDTIVSDNEKKNSTIQQCQPGNIPEQLFTTISTSNVSMSATTLRA
jgi:hypothetical protein